MKGCNGPLILCAVLLFGTLLLAPAFADMKKVDEVEMAQIKASVTGAPIKNLNCIEKDGTCLEMNQDSTSDKGVGVSSPAVSSKTTTTEQYNGDYNIAGRFYMGASITTTTGGFSVKPH